MASIILLRTVAVGALVAAAGVLAANSSGYLRGLLEELEDLMDSGPQWPEHYEVQDGEEFDYIVVGAGAAGCAAAARLTLAGHSVLLMEAGEDPTLVSRIPAATAALLGSLHDWQSKTIPNNISCLGFENQECLFRRGKSLGGSTAINYMLYVRGHPEDYEFNLTGWTWDDMKPYFLRYEGLEDLELLSPSSIPHHNTSGFVRTAFFDSPDNAWHSRIKEGFHSLNFPFNPDINGESQIGVTQVIGYVHEGERMSAARAYLVREDVRNKLKVAKNTRCTGVIFNQHKVAQGVTAVHGLLDLKIRLYAKREVILSAGAIGTSQILMLSGVGPADHLKEFDIPVVADLPVGDNMGDHILPLIYIVVKRNLLSSVIDLIQIGVQAEQWIRNRDGPFASNGLTDVMALANTQCYDVSKRQLVNNRTECELPTVQIIHAYVDRGLIQIVRPIFKHMTWLKDDIINQLISVNSESAIIITSPILLKPFSRGTVRLASRDPLDDPAIYHNYLDDERDVEEMLRAITIIEDLINTPAYKKQNASILHLDLPSCPDYGEGPAAAEYWRCYVRHLTSSVYHATGTSALGSVLDANMRVRGVQHLRVADLGVLPQVPRGNTAAAALALGERVADFVLHEPDH